MSRTTSPTPETSPRIDNHDRNFSPAYRSFIDRLRSARLDRRLSIEHMAERVDFFCVSPSSSKAWPRRYPLNG